MAQVDILLKEECFSIREIAKKCNVSSSSVQRIKTRLSSCSTEAKRKGRCGRKAKSTLHDNRMLLRNLSRKPYSTANELRIEWELHSGVRVTSQTVRNRLKAMNCSCVSVRKVPSLTPAMRQKRLQFEKNHSNWDRNLWRRVCFSDESLFECHLQGHNRVWKQQFHEAPTIPSVRHSVKVMIWGIFHYGGGGRLHVYEGTMNAEQYCHVLRDRLFPQMREWFPDNSGIFMHDKAPCHTARVVQRLLA